MQTTFTSLIFLSIYKFKKSDPTLSSPSQQLSFTSSFHTSSNFQYSTIDKYGNTIAVKRFANDDDGDTVIEIVRNYDVPMASTFTSRKTVHTTLTKGSKGLYVRRKTQYEFGEESKNSAKIEVLNKSDSANIDGIIDRMQAVQGEPMADFSLDGFFDLDGPIMNNKTKDNVKRGRMDKILEELMVYDV